MALLYEVVIFLVAAVIAVPIFRRLGLGAVLGYLAAGLAIGPWGLNLVGEVEDTIHFAELGVVLLMFIIGLELQPSRLWTMRKSVSGLGGLQVLVTCVLLTGVGLLLGLPPAAAVVVGASLSLSSTAFALQVLAEKNQLTTRYGRAAFSILLFQDLAVIPLLALVPLLGAQPAGPMDGSALEQVAVTAAILAAVVLGGRHGLRFAFRVVAATRIREVFTAMALLTVLGMALLMDVLGLSMALGAFIAGLLLANSEFRHALEADIEPFKGLLLGLFFIAVGMSLDVGQVVAKPLLVAGLVVGLVALKAAVLYGVGRWHGLKPEGARALAIAISQGGEFAFVILGVAVSATAVTRDLADLLIAVVTLSMVATPLLFLVEERMRARLKPAGATDFDQPPEQDNHVIIAGFGRFGQIVARVLRAKKIRFTALEINPEQVDFVRNFGNIVYYGDASRLDLLYAAKTESAAAFVLAVDDVEASVHIAEVVRETFPKVPIYARARNRKHFYRLMDLGVEVIRRETFLASLDLTREVLKGIGLSTFDAEKAVTTFREHDEKRLYAHQDYHNDEEKMRYFAQKAAEELETLFTEDVAEDEKAARDAAAARRQARGAL